MNIRQLIDNYLRESMLLQIATSVNGIPWICTVCFAYDSHFNLYWFSRHPARHSQEINRNPHVAGAVALPYAIGDKPRGLQFTGMASELHHKIEVSAGLVTLQSRYGVKRKRVDQLRHEIFSGSQDYGLYRLCPDSIIFYDTLNFPKSPRQVYEVSNLPPMKQTAQSHPGEHP